jgi:hypothetical protein
MKTTIAVTLLSALLTPAPAAFGPSVRVDHENRPSHGCFHAAIATGPHTASGQTVYAVIENDSFAGIIIVRSDIYFQKSTDNGRTWLARDRLIRKGEMFACYPDIMVDQDGSIYIVFTERPSGGSGHFYCVRSTDMGETWSPPARIDDNTSAVAAGWARVATDTTGSLFAAWNDDRDGRHHIWSSVSTDHGTTWRANVRVDDDTVPSDCHHADVAVQPGTNTYLVVSSNPVWVRPGYINNDAAFTRSTDGGQTFAPCVTLDTFSGYCGQPHVVADSAYVICDFTGASGGNQMATEARVSANVGDTWSQPVRVTDLDTLYSSYLNGGKLAIDPSGSVHSALMVCDLLMWEYEIYYARSDNHGLTWLPRERVNDPTNGTQADPDIAADSAGYAYVVWQDQRNSRDEIWFATNAVVGVKERSAPGARRLALSVSPNPARGSAVLRLLGTRSELSDKSVMSLRVFDASGRQVLNSTLDARHSSIPLDLRPLPAGLYVARLSSGRESASTRLVVLED